jgi:GNAT superfamily N-acetyltransferase
LEIEISQVLCPVSQELAWQIESFLLKILEYGDYSFRSALLGKYSENFGGIFSLAWCGGRIVGAAGCLFDSGDPQISILGPVVVDDEFRRQGIATKLIENLMGYLESQGTLAVYLGVKLDYPARELYKRVGFEVYQGIVMRRLLCSKDELECKYYLGCDEVKVRAIRWGDYAAISALMVHPVAMKVIDYSNGIFSSAYVSPQKFLPMFPEMMKSFRKTGGQGYVLVGDNKESIVGAAFLHKQIAQAREHIGVLDFFVHDHYTDKIDLLVEKTLVNLPLLTIKKVLCYILKSDQLKLNVIERLGGKKKSTLHADVFIEGCYEDVYIYEVKGAVL